MHTQTAVFAGGSIRCLTGKHTCYGRGTGSVLLNNGTGGQSSGGSYSSLDDYKHTTGINPLAGRGLNDKLQKLMIKPRDSKPKNIKFDM